MLGSQPVIGGSGNFYVTGSMHVEGVMQVLYMQYASNTVSVITSTPSMGEWNVFGDLSIDIKPFMYGA